MARTPAGRTRQPARRGRRRSLIKPRHKRRVAGWLTWGVVLLQGAMLLTWAVAPTWHPPRVLFWRLIWAWMHEPTFYPFVALLIGGPVLTLIAARIRGWHRLWLALAWAVFIAVTVTCFQDHLDAMSRVLWWKYVE